jgi:Protein of unknown function (DUF4232)
MIRSVLGGTLVILALGVAGCGNTQDRSGAMTVRPVYCKAKHLELRSGPFREGVTQQIPLAFAVRNVSGASCRLRGYPRIALLDKGGSRLQFSYRSRGDEDITGSLPRTIRLKPGAAAYFGINKSACAQGGPKVTRLIVVLPNDAGKLAMALPIEPDLTHCGPGDAGHTVDVTPVEGSKAAVNAPAPTHTPSVFRTASPSAVARFVTRTDRAMGRRFTASYRVVLFRFRGRIFRGRVSATQIPGTGAVFREKPGFLAFEGSYAYELFTSRRFDVNCDLTHRDSKWSCMSEVGEGMGSMSAQNDEMIPEAFTDGMDEAVSEYGSPALLIPAQAARYMAPVPMFLSTRRVNGRGEDCLSIGNAAGAVGRVCTTRGGVIVSYRLATRQGDNGYASAQLVSYTPKVNPHAVIPPAKPVEPGK